MLADPAAHRRAIYDLTGRPALTLAQAASIIAEVRGTPVRYHEETRAEAHASRAHFGAPAWQVDAWVSTYEAIAAGELAEVNDTVERLTGRAAITLREHLERATSGSRSRLGSTPPHG